MLAGEINGVRVSKHWLGAVCIALIFATPALAASSSEKLSFGIGQPVPHGNIVKGQHVFDAICWACHSHNLSGGKAPPLTGSTFYKTWQGQRADALFDFIRNSMPRDDPGFLSDDMAHDLVAYIVTYSNNPKSLMGGRAGK